MNNWPAKNKIFGLLVLWLGLITLMFFSLFGILDRQNLANLESMAQQRKDLAMLKAERESFTRAQQDLDLLAKKQYQPEDFFSKDVTLVKELRILEDWADRLGVKIQISGISGTIASVPKAKTQTSLAVIQYGISINGEFSQVLNYIQVLENLSFITSISSMNLNNSDRGNVSAGVTASLYLRK
jgi:Tfp pilus assembly protein PilO